MLTSTTVSFSNDRKETPLCELSVGDAFNWADDDCRDGIRVLTSKRPSYIEFCVFQGDCVHSVTVGTGQENFTRPVVAAKKVNIQVTW